MTRKYHKPYNVILSIRTELPKKLGKIDKEKFELTNDTDWHIFIRDLRKS